MKKYCQSVYYFKKVCYNISNLFNNEYRKQFVEAGLQIVGLSPDDRLVEIVEVPQNDWFVGVQFHPEFKSRPNRCQPLFHDFVQACVNYSEK